MHKFTDTSGNTWHLSINVAAIKQVKGLLDIDLLEIAGSAEEREPGRDLLTRISTDPVLLVDLLYCLCKEQADKEGISDEAFGRAMAGNAIAEATDAFLEEFADFFHEGKRQLLKKAFARMKDLEQTAIELATGRIESKELDDELLKAMSTPGN